MVDSDLRSIEADGVDLVLALCHEIGNVIGAIRLHAHLLDPELSALEINQSAVELDDLSARSSALLMQIRPLLRADPEGTPACDPEALLDEMRALLHEQGGRGASVGVGSGAGLEPVDLGSAVLRALLSGFAFHAIEALQGKGTVRLDAEGRAGAVAFLVEDDAEPEEPPAEWRDQARRGRPLQCAVASHILARAGGELEVARDDRSTRIALVVPVRSSG